jgi:hypothetical protein
MRRCRGGEGVAAGLDPPAMDPPTAGGEGAGRPRRGGGGGRGGGRAGVEKEPGGGRSRQGGRWGPRAVEMQRPRDCATGRGVTTPSEIIPYYRLNHLYLVIKR